MCIRDRYNTSRNKEKYNEKRLCRVVGGGLGVITLVMAAWSIMGDQFPVAAFVISIDVYKRQVYIIYTRMANAANMVAEMEQLLPLKKASFRTPAQVMVDIHQEEIEMVPSAEEVLNSIVPNYLHGIIYGCLVESYASEHNSRMMAMDAATSLSLIHISPRALICFRPFSYSSCPETGSGSP